MHSTIPTSIIPSKRVRPSRVLRETREGRVATCAKLSLSDARVIELCGLAGYSTVWLCMEHVANDWSEIEGSVRAAKIHDMDVIVRVTKGSYSDYVRPLECDATGLMIPHIETAAEARKIVDRCRFQPLGNRALDGGNVDGAFCQIPVNQYLQEANSERFLILQIESPRGVENVEEIAAVAGYEFLLFGPGDYAHKIGKAGQYDCPEVEDARRRVEAAAQANGKKCVAVGLPYEPVALSAKGYFVASIASDVVGLGTYLADQLRVAVNGSEETPVGSLYNPQAAEPASV